MPHPPAGTGASGAHGSPAHRAARTRKINLDRQLSRILEKGAREAGAVALSPTLFVQAMLPHQEVFERDADGRPVEIPDGIGGTMRLLAREYSATNGEFTLSVRAGMEKGPGHLHPRVSRGIPYGGLARLLLAFIVTEARTKDSPTIDLGGTISAFCARMDITPSGGDNGRLRYVLDQLQRLATCVVTFEWETITPGRRDLKGEHLLVVDDYHFWSRAGTRTSEPIDGGSITLSARFWSEIVSSCFPLDFRKAQLFRGRPAAYDLYLWLTYRLAGMQRTGRPRIVVSYDDLHAQLGSHYQSDEHGVLTARGKKDFAYQVRKALRAIRGVWPELFYETPRGRIVLHSTGPDVEYRPPKKPKA
ncbi:replication protein RepA [Rubricoccus marinus]|uniref:Plasmid encoded RepA protein n=1 Tax=Rubricoccus marinus TaxID=716817 RepID=A0A259TUW2_9BACT|nr:replication protein RepA [Rubricoccus marinus]OZC01486.1 hypothetical protein BSZ36_17585 [Rubricoccus marinus]